jgi:hypothetical protein
MPSGLLQHLADEGGCGRFPIGAGYGDHREADLPPGPFELTNYFYFPASRFFKRPDIQWNTGADDYPVHIEKIFEPVGPQAQRATRLLDTIQRALEFRAGAQVCRGHFGPPALEQSAYGPA